MINHIVMFKLKSVETSIEKQEIIDLLRDSLKNLQMKISEIKFLEVGVNKFDTPRSFDLVLNTKFETIEDLEKYGVHPEHLKVVELVKKYAEQSVVVDY